MCSSIPSLFSKQGSPRLKRVCVTGKKKGYTREKGSTKIIEKGGNQNAYCSCRLQCELCACGIRDVGRITTRGVYNAHNILCLERKQEYVRVVSDSVIKRFRKRFWTAKHLSGRLGASHLADGVLTSSAFSALPALATKPIHSSVRQVSYLLHRPKYTATTVRS